MIPPKSAEPPPEDKAGGTLATADTVEVGFPSLAGKPSDFDSSDSSVKKEVVYCECTYIKHAGYIASLT